MWVGLQADMGVANAPNTAQNMHIYVLPDGFVGLKTNLQKSPAVHISPPENTDPNVGRPFMVDMGVNNAFEYHVL